jgi:hypothetical protein
MATKKKLKKFSATSALNLRLRAGRSREEGAFQDFLFTALKGRSFTGREQKHSAISSQQSAKARTGTRILYARPSFFS